MAAALDDGMFAPDESLVDIDEIKNVALSSRINKACEDALSKRNRTEEEVMLIFQLCSGMPAFDKLAKYERIELCKVVRYIRYQKDEIIFQEGDDPDGFYFILSGSVIGRKKTDDTKRERMKGLEEIAQDTFVIRQGSGFGEGAMTASGSNPVFRSQRKRAATIQCAEDVEILKVDVEDYVKVLAYTFQQELEEKVAFLSKMPLWADFSHDKLTELSKCITIAKYQPNKAVIQQDIDDRSCFFIIKSGEFKVVKEMAVTYVKRVRVDINRTEQKEFKVNKMLHVATLGPYDYFGEIVFLRNTRRTASVISATKSEVYVLPKIEFEKHVAVVPRVMEMLRQHEMSYASDDAILRAYEEHRSWERYKQKLVSQVITDRDNKKALRRMQRPTCF